MTEDSTLLNWLVGDRKSEKAPPKNPLGKEWYCLNNGLRLNVGWLYKFLRKDYHRVYVIAGSPGEGKSTLAMQICADLDPEFSIEQVCRDNREFGRQLYKIGRYQALIYDEGGLGFLSRESMSLSNRTLIKSFQIIRAKNNVIFICIPDYFMLDSGIRTFMVNGLFVVNKRGTFTYYNGHSARAIGKMGKWSFGHVRFRGEFNKRIPFEEYWERKEKGIKVHLKEFTKQGLLSPSQVAEQIGASVLTVRRAILTGVLPAAEVGTMSGSGKRYLIKPSDVYLFKMRLKFKKVSATMAAKKVKK